jgi:preprotein translocase subunit YajC
LTDVISIEPREYPVKLQALIAQSEGGSGAFSLVFFALIFVAMYFLLIRPQRRRMSEARALQSSIGEGDEVLLASGIFGFVVAIEGDVLWLDIAEGVDIRVSRSAVARRVAGPATAPGVTPGDEQPAE